MFETRIMFEVLPAEAPVRLGVFLRRRGASMHLVRSQKHVEKGILVNGEAAHTNRVLQTADVVVLTLVEEEASVPPQAMELDIVHEDEHAMVVNKPARLVMHPTRSHVDGTLANGFSHLMHQRGTPLPFRPVGRLDADTSGLVLLAMNAYAAPLLGKSMQKEYVALATGAMPLGRGCIDAPLGPRPDSLIAQQVTQEGRRAVTEYEVLSAGREASLVRVWPKTGRTHQIRAHFAHVGHALLGDGLYGGDCSLMGRHALHCAGVCFEQPQSEGKRHFEVTLPEDMRRAMAAAELCKECEKTKK